MVKVRNHILTEEQMKIMRKSIFEKEGITQEPYIKVPASFFDYIIKQDESPNWKGQVLLTYIGIIIAYREAHFTYRDYHMGIENIMDFVGANSNNERVLKAFTKTSWLSENKYIERVNDMPYGYTLKGGKMVYKLASDLKKKDREAVFSNMGNRQVRSIEPVRHTKGIRRVRGRGFQVLEEPVDSEEAKNYVTLTYKTINKFVHGYMTATDFYVLGCLKHLTKNGYLTRIKTYNVSYAGIGEAIGMSENTILKCMNVLRSVFIKGLSYQTSTHIIQGNFKSKSKLYISENEI